MIQVDPWNTDKFYQYLVDELLDSRMRCVLLIHSRILAFCMDDLECVVILDYVLFNFETLSQFEGLVEIVILHTLKNIKSIFLAVLLTKLYV